MIKVGKRQKLVINNFASVGAYLFAGTDDDKDNILLPNNEIEGKDLKEGDEVEVLIYRDSEDRLIATFRKTEALVGTLAKLEVVDDNPILGAFLDWGLNKDLMLPNSQKETKVEIGKKYLVGLYEDSKGRVSATMKIYKFLMPSNDIKKGDIVNATVYRVNDEIGTFVAVEDRYFGLIPKSECFEEYSVGDELTLRVTRVREDKKLSATGIFEGKVLLRWYINNKGVFLFDDIEEYSDDYRNNQFVGTWTSYKTGVKKVANWGICRIPCSGDLDWGAAEFSPAPEYRKYGWEDYKP